MKRESEVAAGQLRQGPGETGGSAAGAEPVPDRARATAAAPAAGQDPRRRRGQAGERIAQEHLLANDYSILSVNFRTRYGEIDIIARDGGTVAFVEVKARRNKKFGEPFEAVSPRKQQQIKRMASIWLAANQGEESLRGCEFRFDVISILLDADGGAAELLHLEDAFR